MEVAVFLLSYIHVPLAFAVEVVVIKIVVLADTLVIVAEGDVVLVGCTDSVATAVVIFVVLAIVLLEMMAAVCNVNLDEFIDAALELAFIMTIE